MKTIFQYTEERRRELVALLPPAPAPWGDIWTVAELEKAAVSFLWDTNASRHLPDRDKLAERREQRLAAISSCIELLRAPDGHDIFERIQQMDEEADRSANTRLDHTTVLATALLNERLSSVDIEDTIALIALHRLRKQHSDLSLDEELKLAHGRDTKHRDNFICEVYRIWVSRSGEHTISDDAKAMDFIANACDPVFDSAKIGQIGRRTIREIINKFRRVEAQGNETA